MSADEDIKRDKDGLPKNEVPDELPSLPKETVEKLTGEVSKDEPTNPEKAPEELPDIEVKEKVEEKVSEDVKEAPEELPEIKVKEKVSEDAPKTEEKKEEVVEEVIEEEKPDATQDLIEQNTRLLAKLKKVEKELVNEDFKEEELRKVFDGIKEEEEKLRSMNKDENFFSKLINNVLAETQFELPDKVKVMKHVRDKAYDQVNCALHEELKVQIAQRLVDLKELENQRLHVIMEMNALKDVLQEKEMEMAQAYSEIYEFFNEQKDKIKDQEHLLKELSGSDRFYFEDGSSIGSLLELKQRMNSLKKSEFDKHNKENNFSNWIKDCFKDKDLAKKIKSAKSKKEVQQILEESIV
jgi:hypothetical protein